MDGGLFRQVDAGDSHGGEPLFASDEPETFVCGGFHPDTADVQVKRGRDVVLHGLKERSDLRRFGQKRCVNIDDSALVKGDLAGYLLQEKPARSILPAGVGILEEVADIGLAESAQDGIAEGMEEDVGVGMAGESPGVGNVNATKYQLAAFGERVNVVTNADMDHGRRLPAGPDRREEGDVRIDGY